MKSLLTNNAPCEEYFNFNKSDVLIAAANGGNGAICAWTDSHWTVFRTQFKSWLDEMHQKNPLYTEKYMKEVKLSL